MIRRSTWILLGVFIVGLAATIYLQRSGGLSQTAGTETPTPVEKPLMDIQAEAIQTLRLENSTGRVIALERQADGTSWKLLEPREEAADADKVDPAVSSLAELSELSSLEANLDLKVIGLETPGDTITIGLSGGEQHILLIGTATPIGTGYYARLDGGTPVVVSKYPIDSVLEMLNNPPTLATATPLSETGTAGSTEALETPATIQPETTETATTSP